jgi:hypothetical protein
MVLGGTDLADAGVAEAVGVLPPVVALGDDAVQGAVLEALDDVAQIHPRAGAVAPTAENPRLQTPDADHMRSKPMYDKSHTQPPICDGNPYSMSLYRGLPTWSVLRSWI